MTVSCSIKAHIGWMTLDRPKALQALSLPMIDSMTDALLLWQNDPDVHAVVVQASPSKAFCAGGDIRKIYEERGHFAEQMNFFEREYRLNQLIHHFPKPYIALMDGITMGGGVGISLHGSHPIATENFSFAMPETGIGFFPDVGASHILSRCPGQFGLYLGLTGDRITAKDAFALRLVKGVVDSEELPKLIKTLSRADLSEDAHAKVDHCLQKYLHEDSSSPLMKKEEEINACFIPDSVERILERLSQQKEKWFQALQQKMLTLSPLSLKITLQQLRSAKHKDLVACLEMDGRLVRHFLQDHDFYEGIRAQVIDKDKKPYWQPRTLSEVNAMMVNRYFETI